MELHHERMENLAVTQLREQERATRVAIFNGVTNAMGHAATYSAVRSEGAATRATLNANAAAAERAQRRP